VSQPIGLIGLGNAGLAIATAMLRHRPVAGFDLAPARRAAAAEAGVQAADSLSALADAADTVILSLPKPEASVATVNALLAGGNRPALIIETSTVTPQTAQACAIACNESGTAFVDAAIAGGVASMAAGEITFFLGGDDTAKTRAFAALEPITERIVDLGPVGAGMGTKVVHNGVMHALMVVLIEAFAMSSKLGIPDRTMVEILSRPEALMRPLTHRVQDRMLAGDYAGGMSVSNARKDSVLALETAQALGVPLFATLAAHTPYEIAEAQGIGDLDYAALASLWEQWCAIDFKQPG
jgi:3-hydroxyisobutyrate dehydrogenase